MFLPFANIIVIVLYCSEKDKEDFPEGGRGWLVLAGTCVAMVMSFGLVNSFGQYQLYYKEQFPDTNVSVISLIGSVEPALMYAVSLVVVPLINNEQYL